MPYEQNVKERKQYLVQGLQKNTREQKKKVTISRNNPPDCSISTQKVALECFFYRKPLSTLIP